MSATTNEPTIKGSEILKKLQYDPDYDEVYQKFRHRALKTHVKKGEFPKPLYTNDDDNDLIFSYKEVLEHLGVEDLNEPFLTLEEMAEHLNAKIGNVNNWAMRGKIPSHRLTSGKGSPYYFRASEVEAAMQSQVTFDSVWSNMFVKHIVMRDVFALLLEFARIPDDSKQILQDILIDNKTVTQISLEQTITKEGARQRFMAAIDLLYKGLTQISETFSPFANTSLKTILELATKQLKADGGPELLLNVEIPKLIEESDLSNRAKNILRTKGIVFIKDLINVKESNLVKTQNCGASTVAEIKEFAKENNIFISWI